MNRLRNAAFAAVLMAIQEEQPPKPSTRLSESKDSLPSISAQRQAEPAKLPSLVRGELDWIVMKALEKDRARRYETASGLARDIERYLRDETVEACPPTLGYRVRKFACKHKAALVTSTAFVLLLVMGLLGTTLGLVEAWHQQAATKQALKNEAQQRQLAVTKAAEAKASKRRADVKAAEALANERQARDEKLISNRHLYAARMILSQTAWEETRVAETVRLLDLCRPAAGQAGGPDDLRGFEWHYWNRLAHSYQLSIEGHTGQVWSVAFSPDGKRLASANDDQTVKVWDATSGAELLTLKGHTSSVTSVAFSPDGKRLASAGYDLTVKVWDATPTTEDQQSD